jgi:DNA mismatch repair protein MutS2
MRNTSGETLEFDALKEVLGRYLSTALGRRELAKVRPLSERNRIRAFLDETAEALEYQRLATQGPQQGGRGAAIRLRFDAPADIERTVQKLRIEGAALDGKEIFDLSGLLDRCGEARHTLTSLPERYPLLSRRAEPIADFRPLIRDLAGKILPDGSVADDASVNLHRLRRDQEKQQKLIQQSLERFMRKHKDDGTLQEEFVTIRNDRFVLPVVAGQQRKVNGVIHGASHSGATLFVEPLETIDLNNELVRLRDEEIAEIHRILADLTARLSKYSREIRYAVDAMAIFEFIFAKAQFALDFNCTIPKLSAEGERRLHLHNARHPLLEDLLKRQGKSVTPVSLTLDESNRTLLISGPNTGGKTVAMKTVGLLCLMAQAGIPVPCEDAEFPVLDQVLADIGDHQSIQESLSSFSAHVAGVKTMLEAVTRDSLVLLDELGRATDPEEGGALGVAMLDTFRSTGAFTLASTHLLALKVYGSKTSGVVNGSMGFDDQTLEPTYVLRVGAPGKSAGLDIASRLGLPTPLIDHARSLLSTNERDIARFLSELHAKLDAAAQLESRLKDEIARVNQREAALERDYQQKRDRKLQELEDKSKQLAAEFEQHARQTIEQITQNVEQRKASETALRKVAKARREFLEDVNVTVEAEKPAPAKDEKPRLKIEEGARVKLKGIRQPAKIRKIHGDRIEVEAGFMKMQIGFDDIEEVLDAKSADAQLPKNVSFQQQGPSWDVVYSEINVVGKHADEAVDEVDKFLDKAALAQVDRIRIVHGFGMGVLRKAIAKLLQSNPHVSRFYEAEQHEGGGGATVVELK